MDFFTFFFALAVLLAFLLHRVAGRYAAKCTNGSAAAPEPPGALPLIGHLHLLTAKAPAARILACLADKHGAIFSLRLGSHSALVVSGWEAVQQCFTVNDTVFASRPLMAVGKYMGYKHAMFALAPYGAYWRDVRKMVTVELMTSHRLEKLRHVRESEVNLALRDLHVRCARGGKMEARVAMNSWFEHVTFNIIVRMLAGKRYSGDGEDEGFKAAVKRALYLSGLFVVSDAIPWLEWADVGGHLRMMKKTGKEADAVLGRWLEEHIQKRKEGDEGVERDFIDVMLSVIPEKETIAGFDRDTVIKSTIWILVQTGSESTAETLIWGLSLLLNHRSALKATQDELDAVVGKDRWVQESDISSLHYLQAVVKETLRLYPPGPLSGPREATEDCWVNGYWVQKGTRPIVNLWKLQRDPRVWANPNEFRPERFLSGAHAGVGFRGGQQFAYIPFSGGRRMCPSVNFALQVIQLTLARLLQGFDLTTPGEAPVDMTEGVGLAFPKVQPLEAIVSPRLPPEAYNSHLFLN